MPPGIPFIKGVSMKKPFFLNNCRGRDHLSLYGNGAFYDLNLTGPKATMATDIAEGDKCLVATRDSKQPKGPHGIISFSWFVFSHEKVCRAEEGARVRVFFGECLGSEKLTKSEAASTDRNNISIFFKRNGHFKRQSVIKP